MQAMQSRPNGRAAQQRTEDAAAVQDGSSLRFARSTLPGGQRLSVVESINGVDVLRSARLLVACGVQIRRITACSWVRRAAHVVVPSVGTPPACPSTEARIVARSAPHVVPVPPTSDRAAVPKKTRRGLGSGMTMLLGGSFAAHFVRRTFPRCRGRCARALPCWHLYVPVDTQVPASDKGVA